MTETDIEGKEEKSVSVVDPEDYAKARKIQQIEDARESVIEARKSRDEIAQNSEWQEPPIVIHRHLIAERVADYGTELLPLLKRAKQKGIIDDYDTLKVSRGKEISLLQFIYSDGQGIKEICRTYKSHQYPAKEYSMAVFRRLDELKLQIGLGPTLEEELPPAEI